MAASLGSVKDENGRLILANNLKDFQFLYNLFIAICKNGIAVKNYL